MIKSHFVTIQSRTATTGTEGERTYTYATLKSITADVQPASLSSNQLAAWGLTDMASNLKTMYYDKDAAILMSMRAVVEGETYEIRGINRWPTHDEAILSPVQGV